MTGDDRDVAIPTREGGRSPVAVVAPPGRAVELRSEEVETSVAGLAFHAGLRRAPNVLRRREHRRERLRLSEHLSVEEGAEEGREVAARRHEAAAAEQVDGGIDARDVDVPLVLVR